jgi:hypothetical protein
MHSLAHLVDRTVSSLQPVLILVALGGWAIAFAGQIVTRRPGSPRPVSAMFVAGGLIFAGIIGGEFLIGAYLKSVALNEIHPQLSADIGSLTVNGTQFGKADDLIAALRNIRDTTAHHSHPTTEYRVLLNTSQGALALHVCRDSQDPHEYWVFYPNFHSTASNAVGHIFTEALDNF